MTSRPTGPRLQIKTDQVNNGYTSQDTRISQVSTPTVELPTFNVESVDSPFTAIYPPSNPSIGPSHGPKKSRVLNETRKLLDHLLNQLQTRPRPPSVFSTFTNNTADSTDRSFSSMVGSVKVAVKLGAGLGGKLGRTQTFESQEEQEDEEEDVGHSTDATLDLMAQLKEILLLSMNQGWELLEYSDDGDKKRRQSGGKISSPFRKSKRSLQPDGSSRSRSPSPSGGDGNMPELISQCISILASIIAEDCRFKIASARPTRPPNALQAVILDVARYIVRTQSRNPKVILALGFALIPAFSTFPPEMHNRLLTFFEDSIVREALQGLSALRSRSAPALPSSTLFDDHTDSHSDPLVIQIEEPDEEEVPAASLSRLDYRPWSSSTSCHFNITSSNAPRTELDLIYLASMTTPLLAAMFENIDLVSRHNHSLDVLHRFHHLLDTIVSAKPDAYLNCLEVAAYHTAKARYIAISMLSTFWPRALGHLIVSKPFPILSYADSTGIMKRNGARKDHASAHQFVPWRFLPKSRANVPDITVTEDCQSCARKIEGFALICPLCMVAVHFDCYDYPDGNHSFVYSPPSEKSVQKVAAYRFCFLLTNRRDDSPVAIIKQKHIFRPVNLFALTICFICREPLWGCVMQGVKCIHCVRFAHSKCLDDTNSETLPICKPQSMDSSHVTVDTSVLHSSFSVIYSNLLLSQEELVQRTYEELSILHSALWAQLEILNNGISLGCLIVNRKRAGYIRGGRSAIDDFVLHESLRLLEDYFSPIHQQKHPLSPILGVFMQENGLDPSKHSILFDWSTLVYISSAAKAPYEIDDPSSNPLTSVGMLGVSNMPSGRTLTTDSDAINYPREVLSLAQMRDALAFELHVYSDTAARLLFTWLQALAIFDPLDYRANLFEEGSVPAEICCVFPIPMGFDVSVDVEILVSAVEGCLSDLDLSVNEAGFLLLCRRLWPDGMTSDYALRRLARTVFYWIIGEDESLASILRDYVSKQQPLPGVPSERDAPSWPSGSSARPNKSRSANNGGDYVAIRRTLLRRHARRWLLAFHDLNPTVYAGILYSFCMELAEDIVIYDGRFTGEQTAAIVKKRKAGYLDRVLNSIIRLTQASVTFEVFNVMFLRWLESLLVGDLWQEPMKSLLRLSPREVEATNRFSGAEIRASDAHEPIATTPVSIIMSFAAKGGEDLSHSIKWLCTLTRSGVEVSVANYLRLSNLTGQFSASFRDCQFLVDALLSSTWLKSAARQQLQAVIASLHTRFSNGIVDQLSTQFDSPNVIQFIRQSLAVCLLLCGCERDALISAGLVLASEIAELPPRRKITTQVSAEPDPIVMDPQIMVALERYMDAEVDDVACILAKFLHLFITHSPLLESWEIDNFILRNASVLARCAWRFYEVQRHEISTIRSAFLLRILVVDSQPFHELLDDRFKPTTYWVTRLNACTRLFRVILDVTSPEFNVENRQWRSSIIDAFLYFFGAMWGDEQESIRLVVDTWSQTLLPAHFEAISLCFTEALAKAPVPERLRLINFLTQLHPCFPTWKVLSWEGILEALVEDDYEQKRQNGLPAHHMSFSRSSQGTSSKVQDDVDSDMTSLRLSIILLALQLVADGVSIDLTSLLTLKWHLVQVLGFSDVSVQRTYHGATFFVRFREVAEIPELAIPCLDQLLPLLDASYSFELPPSAFDGPHTDDDTKWPLLVGSLFVDVAFATFCNIRDVMRLPILTVKSMLESLLVIVYKHDFDSKPLNHLQVYLRGAVKRVLDLVLQDISYELRQLALSFMQACVKRWPGLTHNIYDTVDCMTKLIIAQKHNNQDILVMQARSFIEATLASFNGLLGMLFKRKQRQLDPDFFIVLEHILNSNAKRKDLTTENLRDTLLRDTLLRVAENEFGVFQTVLNNLTMFIEDVHHQNYSVELMQAVGVCLTALLRRVLEWGAESIDPAPLLLIPAVVIQHNKAQSRDLLQYTETVLRSILPRYHVKTKPLSRILQVTATLFRKAQTGSTLSIQSGPSVNIIASIVSDTLVEGLRGQRRILPSTLTSIIEAMASSDESGSVAWSNQLFPQSDSVAEHGLHFLQHHSWQDVFSDDDFTASVAVAKIILQTIIKNPEFINQSFGEGERYMHLSLRAWNIIALTALMDPSHQWVPALFGQLHRFSGAYFAALRPYLQRNSSALESATADINHGYIAVKLWLMLGKKRSTLPEDDNDLYLPTLSEMANSEATSVWNELWPMFESLIRGFEAEAHSGTISPLATLIWSSTADLFLFLRQLRCSISSESAIHVVTLTRLRDSSQGETVGAKLTRALRSMTEQPGHAPLETLANQAAKEVIATEKIQVLEKQGREKAVADRKVPPMIQRRMVSS